MTRAKPDVSSRDLRPARLGPSDHPPAASSRQGRGLDPNLPLATTAANGRNWSGIRSCAGTCPDDEVAPRERSFAALR
jgi:hypothetical protein